MPPFSALKFPQLVRGREFPGRCVQARVLSRLLPDLQPISHFFAEPSLTVRLAGGPHRCEGRVEVQQNGEWHTMCHAGWGMEEAAVVCRELNCGEAKWTPSGTLYTPSTDKDQKVFLQEVICQGHELNLSQCDQVEVFDCTHDEDAGAQCESEYGRAQRLSASCSYCTWLPLSFFFTMTSHNGHWFLVLHISHFLNCGQWRKHYPSLEFSLLHD